MKPCPPPAPPGLGIFLFDFGHDRHYKERRAPFAQTALPRTSRGWFSLTERKTPVDLTLRDHTSEEK